MIAKQLLGIAMKGLAKSTLARTIAVRLRYNATVQNKKTKWAYTLRWVPAVCGAGAAGYYYANLHVVHVSGRTRFIATSLQQELDVGTLGMQQLKQEYSANNQLIVGKQGQLGDIRVQRVMRRIVKVVHGSTDLGPDTSGLKFECTCQSRLWSTFYTTLLTRLRHRGNLSRFTS